MDSIRIFSIGVIVIGSMIMSSRAVNADVSSSSSFQLQDSFSVVGGRSIASTQYNARDSGGEAAPKTFISQILKGAQSIVRYRHKAPDTQIISQQSVIAPVVEQPVSQEPIPTPTTQDEPLKPSDTTQVIPPSDTLPSVTELISPLPAPAPTPSHSSSPSPSLVSSQKVAVARTEQSISNISTDGSQSSEQLTVEEPKTPIQPDHLKPQLQERVVQPITSAITRSAQRVVSVSRLGVESIKSLSQKTVKVVTAATMSAATTVKQAVTQTTNNFVQWIRTRYFKVKQWFKTSFNDVPLIVIDVFKPLILSAQTVSEGQYVNALEFEDSDIDLEIQIQDITERSYNLIDAIDLRVEEFMYSIP